VASQARALVVNQNQVGLVQVSDELLISRPTSLAVQSLLSFSVCLGLVPEVYGYLPGTASPICCAQPAVCVWPTSITHPSSHAYPVQTFTATGLCGVEGKASQMHKSSGS